MQTRDAMRESQQRRARGGIEQTLLWRQAGAVAGQRAADLSRYRVTVGARGEQLSLTYDVLRVRVPTY